VKVRGKKTKDRERFVPVVTDWQRELLAYVKEHADGKDGLLFTEWGSALRSIKQAAQRAEIKHMNRHGLRHCYSAWMKQEGVPNSELYLAMGHASTTMLERVYGKPDGQELAGMMTRSIAIGKAALLTVIDGGKSPAKKEKDLGERLYQRGGTWYAWVYEDGEQVRFSTGCTSQAEALTVLAQRERDHEPVKLPVLGKSRKRPSGV